MRHRFVTHRENITTTLEVLGWGFFAAIITLRM